MAQHSSNPPINSSSKHISILSWLVVIILLVICIDLFVSRNKAANQSNIALEEKQHIIDSIKTNMGYLQLDFDATSAKLDELMSKNAALDSAVQIDGAALSTMQQRVKNILTNKSSTPTELMKARELISEMSKKVQLYESRIAELEKENTALTVENKFLAEERDETVESNIGMHMAGRVLQVSNIRPEFIRKKNNGGEKSISTAKKVDELRITFDISENRIVESGTKEIYLRIKAPDGKVLQVAGTSGDMNTVNYNKIKYSLMQEIAITRNLKRKDVVVRWIQVEPYAKGNYKIELYNEGYRIADAQIALK